MFWLKQNFILLRNLARIVPGTSIVYRSDHIGSDLIPASQDGAKHSFTVPAPVAVHSEHMSSGDIYFGKFGDFGGIFRV